MNRLNILIGNPGFYAINFKADGIYSDPILFRTDFPSQPSFKIIAQPTAIGVNSTTGISIGNSLATTKVQLSDASGMPLVSYYITASITRTSNMRAFPTSMIDWSDTGDARDDTLVLVPGVIKVSLLCLQYEMFL